MWSQFVLCLLVGLAYASSGNDSPAWDSNTQYTYFVQARSMVGFDEISDYYSGFLLQAYLEISPRSDGNLDARIVQAQYSPVHAKLNEWDQEIPELIYQPLHVSEELFQIELQSGVIRNIIVSRRITNWEANIIKSFVSNIQLDTKAENLLPSSFNVLPDDATQSGIFKTYEETVTGVYETLYEIRPLQLYILQSKPWLVSRDLDSDENVLQIVKTKNFTNSRHSPSYHFGLHGVRGYEPSNKIGNFLSRSSVSYATVIGSLKDFTIQNSITVEEIYLSPTFTDKQKGGIHTLVNITLSDIKQQRQQNDNNVINPVEVGVVFSYDDAYGENVPRESHPFDYSLAPQGSAEAQEQSRRNKRSIDMPRSNYLSGSYNYPASFESPEDEKEWYNKQPKLSEAPRAPLLPFTVGYDGQSIKKKQNIVELVSKLVEQIAKEYQQLQTLPKQIPQQNVAGKFVTLTSLIRIMDENEIQQVAARVYSEHRGIAQAASWITYSDAVAQAGTGPAFSALKIWINSGKLHGSEAAYAVATAADAVREPTLEYMQAFFEMVQDDNIMQQEHLNESTVLAYANLAYHVYGSSEDSHNKYPVHGFGSFYTKPGQDFIVKIVIRYFTKQLNTAIYRGDTQKIHTYIRVLGNIGRQEILESFEPYLEGDKKASHFQRFLMVLALDRFTENNPRVARSVLYKIYQNPSEHDQVRAAAVHGIMRTGPSPVMLQRMAAYTKTDGSSCVSSVVKSAIEYASQLEGSEYYELRQAAESATPFLTSEEYGSQYGDQILRSYVNEQLPVSQDFKENFLTVGGEDDALPKGLIYALTGRFGGVKEPIGVVHAIVSSLEDLVSVLKQQTKEYQQQKRQKQQAHPEQTQWTSEYVANLFKMQNEQREQLEGYFLYKMESFQKMFSFDNRTIENLTALAGEFEQELRQGKYYQSCKMIIPKEIAIAVPTALGVPFLYTYDIPFVVKFEASVKATANPQISQGGYLQKPTTVRAEFDVKAVVSARIQSQLGIFTPFDHQRYSAGYDKNFQINVPIAGSVEVNIPQKQLKAEIQNPGSQQDVQVLHYSNIPYTAKNDIYSTKPEVKKIMSERPFRLNKVFGQKQTGVAFDVQMTTDQLIDPAYVFERIAQRDFVAAVLGPWTDINIHYVNVDVGISSSKSSTDKAAFELGYLHKYIPTPPGSDSGHKPLKLPRFIPQFPEDSEKRQEEFLEKVLDDVNNPEGFVVDASVTFQGKNYIKYYATAGAAKSNVDPKGQFIALVKKDDKQGQPMQFYVYAVSSFPNTNGLDLEYAIQMNPKSQIDYVALLKHNQRNSKIEGKFEFSKSQERREYLQQQPEYQEYQQQSQQYGEHLHIVARMVAEANLLDKFTFAAKYQDIDPQFINVTYKAYSVLRYYLYPRIVENIIDYAQSSNNHLEIQGQFSPDLQYVNFSADSDYGKVEAYNIELNEWFQQLLVPHPVFHVKTRLIAQALKYDTYRPICLIDQSAASTFDNKSYPVSLNNDWTVLFQYVPRRPSSQVNQYKQTVLQQLQELPESYIIYARAAYQSSSQKEIKIVYQNPDTNGKIVELSIRPATDSIPKVYVNDKQIQISQKQAFDLYGGYGQIYALPKGEVKVEICRAFYIISNGNSVKLTATNSKFRDASRGLCGTFTGEPETDFLTPGNCIIHSAEEFVESYTIPEKSRPYSVELKAGQPECVHKGVEPVDYISGQDAGREKGHGGGGNGGGGNGGGGNGGGGNGGGGNGGGGNGGGGNGGGGNGGGGNGGGGNGGGGNGGGGNGGGGNGGGGNGGGGNGGGGNGGGGNGGGGGGGGCTRLQTKYIEQTGEVCFTIRPLPSCKLGCRPSSHVQKQIQVHCTEETNATEMWKNEIRKGASPDFSLKPRSKTIKMEVPHSCLA